MSWSSPAILCSNGSVHATDAMAGFRLGVETIDIPCVAEDDIADLSLAKAEEVTGDKQLGGKLGRMLQEAPRARLKATRAVAEGQARQG